MAVACKTHSSGFVIKARKKKENLLIAYGTSTGTARLVAHRIAREAYSFSDGDPLLHFYLPEVLCMKEITIEYLAEHWQREDSKVIFIVSTTGQGEFPDDTKQLWKDICKKTDLPMMTMNYIVIGLGDSSYELYNYPAKKLNRRLQQLAGNAIFDICLCDDQHDLGYIGSLNAFMEGCWISWIPKRFHISRNQNPVARFALRSTRVDQPIQPSDKVEKLQMIRNDRITSEDHFQDTRLIAFNRLGSNLTFQEGDAIRVYAENFPENVETFFKLFPDLKNQPPFYLTGDPEMKWESIPAELLAVCGPQPWTWEKVATQLLDLQSSPSFYAFEILKCFTTDPLLKEKFNDFCRPEGLEELYNYVNRPRRTILEVLEDFPGLAACVPSNFLFDIIPLMRPRAFSIASPPKESHHIEILVAVVEYKTNLKKSRKGTCSYWLAHHCPLGQSVAIFCEKGSLRPPATEAHVIMIGPGTGVAPFRSMIKQHLQEWDKYLFFGCRNEKKDFYFRDEFEEYTKSGALKLHTAFSRDQNGGKVDYVQDVLLRNPELIKSLLESPLPLYIYVCGRSGDMPKDVWKALQTVISQSGVDKADELLEQMLENGQYQTETY